MNKIREAKFPKKCKECGTDFMSKWSTDKGEFCTTLCYRKWKQRYDMKHKPGFKAINTEYTRINSVIRGKAGKTKPVKNLGCTREEFMAHIESQWRRGWNWDNYGVKWEMNHKRSLQTAFDEGGMEALIEAAYYTNVEPIRPKKNREAKKGRQFVEERKPAWIPIPKRTVTCSVCKEDFETHRNQSGKCYPCLQKTGNSERRKAKTKIYNCYQKHKEQLREIQRLLQSEIGNDKGCKSDCCSNKPSTELQNAINRMNVILHELESL